MALAAHALTTDAGSRMARLLPHFATCMLDSSFMIYIMSMYIAGARHGQLF